MEPKTKRSVSEVRAWMIDFLAQNLKVAPSQVDADEPIAGYGIDSIVLTNMVHDLEQWLGVELSITMFWEHPTINMFAEFISEAPPQA